MSKTTEQLESESVAARKAHDDALDRLDALKLVRKLLSDLEESMGDPKLTQEDRKDLESVHVCGSWLALGDKIAALKVEASKLEGLAEDAQKAFIASWEAA